MRENPPPDLRQQSCPLLINRNDAAHVDRRIQRGRIGALARALADPVIEHLGVRRMKSQPASVTIPFGRSMENHAAAYLERVLEVRLAEEDALDPTGPILHYRLEDRHAARALQAHRNDLSAHRGANAGFQALDRREIRSILVSPREDEKQIPDRLYALFLESSGALRSHTLDELDRGLRPYLRGAAQGPA